MLVRSAIQSRLTTLPRAAEPAGEARLPTALKVDRLPVRTVMLRGLWASRRFAIGDRAGVLGAAQRRSGRPFRVDVRQRVIVKALVSRHAGSGAERGQSLARHIAYLGRSGAGMEGARPDFFDRTPEPVDAKAATADWAGDRHHFRFIISPEHGERIADLRSYVRDVMGRVEADLGEPALTWVATCHYDTDQPHAHVLVRGRRGDGRDLVIPRDYIAYGFRMRAQEAAQERLGDLSRAEAERRIWRETSADRFTGFDRRLLASVDKDGLVDDGVGTNEVWASLTRGRLRHLEALGLATRVGRRFQLHPEMERALRSLQLRRDILRTLHQRQLGNDRSIRELRSGERVQGRVVARGFHDELGALGWIVVRDAGGSECYARLASGQDLPKLGRSLSLLGLERGAHIEAGRGRDLGSGRS